MKGLGTHIELVRELGLERRIRRTEDDVTRRALRDVVIGGIVGFGIIGVLHAAGVAFERLSR